MDDSFKKEIDNIKAETPLKVSADPISIVYGLIFIGIGYWLTDLGSPFGPFMLIVGVVGAVAGILTFTWNSPKVKIIQAIDSFLVALLFLAFLADDHAFENPIIALAVAAFMVWAGYGDLKEYFKLNKAFQQKQQQQQPPAGPQA